MENRIGFGPRLGAFLLDFVLIAILSVVIVFVLGVGGAAAGAAAGGTEDAATAAMGASLGFLGGLMASVVVIYVVSIVWYLLEGFTGFTIGKLIVGIKIGNQDGTKAGISTLLLRYVIKNIAFILGAIGNFLAISAISKIGGLLGLVIFIGCFIVLGAKKQAIHDMIAKTAVFKKSSLG